MKKSFLSYLVILLSGWMTLSSCHSDDPSPATPEQPDLFVGKWDAYRTTYPDNRVTIDGIQYAVLMNYEHGFEIFEDGEYKSRFANGTTFEEGFHTDSNQGTWQIKNDILTFSHTFQGQITTLHFTIESVDEDELYPPDQVG